MKLVILSAGSIASGVARILAPTGCYDELVIADIDIDKASAVAEELGGKAQRFDASDPASIKAVITGADVVFNAVGPFFKFGMPIIRAAIECGVNYVDVCDEFDVAEQIVREAGLDEAAKAAGVTVVFGMGFAPGVTSLLGRWAADQLDTAHSIDVMMAIPYMVNMGATINEHMLHSMSGNVRQFLDGEVQSVPAWADPKPFTLQEPFGVRHAGYMGHPEGITLGRYVPGLRNATVRFTWFEEAGNDMWKSFETLGLTNPEKLEGLPMSPREFLARYMATEAGERALAVSPEALPGTAMQIVAEGELEGEPTQVIFEAHVIYSEDGNGEDPTPRAAAAAVREMLQGRITARGVFSPEACIDPEPFVLGVLESAGVTLTKRIVTLTDVL